MRRFNLALLLSVLLGVVIVTADTQCSSLNEPSYCFNGRDECHWDGVQCVDGAPTTCEQFIFDDEGCTASPLGCYVNTKTGHCAASLPTCDLLSAADCPNRPDCAVDNGVCVVNTNPNTCGGKTDQSGCTSAGCFYDGYLSAGLPRCYSNLQQVRNLFACSYFSHYLDATAAQAACEQHGCVYGRGICADDASQLPSEPPLTQHMNFEVADAAVQQKDMGFELTVSADYQSLWTPHAPAFTSIVFGRVGSGNWEAATQNTRCTTVASQPALGATIYPSTYPDQVALRNQWLGLVTSSQSLSISPDADPMHDEMRRILGEWKASGEDSIIGRVAVGGSYYWNPTIDIRLQMNLNECVASCGCTRTVLDETTTRYVIPISVVRRGNGDVFAASNFEYYADISTIGTVVVGRTSGHAYTTALANITDRVDDCPVGQQRRFFDIRFIYDQVYGDHVRVGLHSLDNVIMKRPGVDTGVVNCFGTEPFALEPPSSCPNNKCTSVVHFRTRCTPIPVNGDGLNQCFYQTADAHVADLGSAAASYPDGLDMKHDFFFTGWVWSTMDPQGTRTVEGPPDQPVRVTINQKAYPVIQNDFSLTIQKATLPTIMSAFAERSEVVSRYRSTDPFVSVIIYLPDPDSRQTFDLRITHVSMVPVDSAGQAIAGANAISWTQLQPLLVRATRNQLGVDCPGCSVLTALAGQIGVDGFAVPISVLRAIRPANGYHVYINYHVTLPVGAPAIVPAGRRLLQASSSESADYNQQGQSEMTIMFDDGESVPALISADLGDPSTSAKRSMGVTFPVVLGSVAATSLLSYYTARHRS